MNGLITLCRTHFLYVALVCLVVLPVLALIVVSPVLPSLWCRHFELPQYERVLGFTLREFEAPGAEGGTYRVLGIATVESNGVFARAGIRPGDVPRTHHGLGEFCSDLAATLNGAEVDLRVYNVADAHQGRDPWRIIPLRVGSRQ